MRLGDAAAQVDHVADLLEREEADAERQRQRERLIGKARDRGDAAEEEIEILEGAEDREIGDDPAVSQAGVAGAAELLRQSPN